MTLRVMNLTFRIIYLGFDRMLSHGRVRLNRNAMEELPSEDVPKKGVFGLVHHHYCRFLYFNDEHRLGDWINSHSHCDSGDILVYLLVCYYRRGGCREVSHQKETIHLGTNTQSEIFQRCLFSVQPEKTIKYGWLVRYHPFLWR